MYSATVYASTHGSRLRFLYAAVVFVGAFVVVGAVAGGFYAWFGPARSRWLLAPSVGPARPNIVVIDIDTLRADRIDAKEGDAWVMPNLRKLAARGVRFDHMISQGGWTAPALDALLSGRYPLTFSVAGGTMPKRAPGSRLFPQILSLYDYQTAALWSFGVPLVHEIAHTAFSYNATLQMHGTSADSLAGQFEGWLGQPPTQPFFLFVHNFDAQVPGPTFGEANVHRFGGERQGCPAAGYDDTYANLRGSRGDAAARTEAITHYDGVLGGYDEVLGRLFTMLDEAGVSDHTYIIVTSNHGEDLVDHEDTITHGSLYDVVTRVPLIIVGPGVAGAGRTVDNVVQTLDLAPTILDLAGVPPDVGMIGKSLRPLLEHPEGAEGFGDRSIFSKTNANNMSLRQGMMKLILRNDAADWRPRRRSPGDAGTRTAKEPWYELYDLAADPDEKHDLAASRPEELARFQTTLTAWRDFNRKDEEGAALTPVSEEMLRRFRENGYWKIVGEDAGREGG